MQLLSLNFLICSVAGIWRPINWSNGANLLYNMFTTFVILMEYYLILTQFLDILLVVDNIDDFATNNVMFVTNIIVCCKMTIILIHRNTIINIIQTLLDTPYKPRNKDEMAIQTKFDHFIRSWSMKYLIMATCSFLSVTTKSLFYVTQGYLIYQVWLPYDRNISLMFWITYIQHVVSGFLATMINVGTETLVFGLILQTCAQLEIFESRLNEFVIDRTSTDQGYALLSSDKEKVLSECIRYHLNIYKYAETVNILFRQILFFQFSGSIVVLCTILYYLSTHITLSETASLAVYSICMFLQIFIYCWCGNEVILKSVSVGDTVYRMDWPSLSISERKEILMIMLRTKIPIKFTSSFLITLSLESYSNILKISYSVFNVLNK